MADVSVDLAGFDELVEQVGRLADPVRRGLAMEQALNSLTSVFLREAKMLTPVLGAQSYTVHEMSKAGEMREVTKQTDSEHMRRCWDAKVISKTSPTYRAIVFNTASYASFVNDGHRQNVGQFVPVLGKRLKAPFVEGLHMNEKAAKITKDNARLMIEQAMTKYLKGAGK